MNASIFKTLTGSALAAVIAAGALAMPASAQSATDRAQRIEERRAAIEARLANLDTAAIQERLSQRERGAVQERIADRIARRTAAFENLAGVTDAQVQERLNTREEQILGALADADPETAAARINEAGAQASDRLANYEGDRLSQQQLDRLVEAAAYAETATPAEVQFMLTSGALRVEAFFDELDPAAISEELNAIGEKALEAQEARASR